MSILIVCFITYPFRFVNYQLCYSRLFECKYRDYLPHGVSLKPHFSQHLTLHRKPLTVVKCRLALFYIHSRTTGDFLHPHTHRPSPSSDRAPRDTWLCAEPRVTHEAVTRGIVCTILYSTRARGDGKMATPKVLPLEHAKGKTSSFFFAFCSLILRTKGEAAEPSAYLWLRRRYFRSSMPKEKLRLSFCILLAYSYLCRRNSGLACRWPPIGGERKVRATQGIPLPNGKRLARVRPCRREQPPKQPQGLPARVRRRGKSPPGPW